MAMSTEVRKAGRPRAAPTSSVGRWTGQADTRDRPSCPDSRAKGETPSHSPARSLPLAQCVLSVACQETPVPLTHFAF